MSRSIWKYPFKVSDLITAKMPKGSEILTVQIQNEYPCMWVLVDVDAEIEQRYFKIIGTGHAIEGNTGKYIGTFQLYNGDLVFHLFEL